MSTCFVCGNAARWTDADTGEALCTNHFHPRRKISVKPKVTISNEWNKLGHIESWMRGSAYELERQVARRLVDVVR